MHFNFLPVHEVQILIRHSQVMLQQRERHTVKQNVKETEQTSTNYMSTIHCKLQEEAEKIRKWQTSSEIELKQKAAKLKESENLILKQRNQVLKLQVENEALLSSLQKEQLDQTQIKMKLKTSRELFIALKNHSENLQVSVERGEEDRDSLRILAADNIQQIHEMKGKIDEIVESHEKRVCSLKASLKDHGIAFDDFKFSSKREIDGLKKDKDDQVKELDRFKTDIEDLSRQLLAKRNDVHELEEYVSKLKENMSNKESVILSQEKTCKTLRMNVENSERSLTEAKSEITNLNESIESSAKSHDDYKADAEKQIEELQNELSDVTDSFTELSTQFNELTSKAERLENENKASKTSISQLVECVENLQNKLESGEQELNEVNEKNEQLQNDNSDLTAALETKELSLNETISLKEESEDKLVTLGEVYNSTLTELETLKSELETHFLKISDLETENGTLVSSLSELNKQVDNYKLMEIENSKLEANVKHLSSSASLKDKEISKLGTENKELHSKLGSLNKQLESLEEGHSNMNSNVKSLETCLLKSKDELTLIQSSFLQQTEVMKAKNIEVKQLRDEIKSFSDKYDQLNTTKNSLKASLVSFKDQCSSVRNEMAQRLTEMEYIEKENLDLKAKVSNLLDDYKSDSSDLMNKLGEVNKTVCQKDEEINKLQSELSKSNQVYSELQVQRITLKEQNEKYSSLISHKDADISALADEIDKLQKKVQKLEKSALCSSTEASDEVKALKNQMKSLENENEKLDSFIKDIKSREEKMVNQKNQLEKASSSKEEEVKCLLIKNRTLETENKDISNKVQNLESSLKNQAIIDNKLREQEKIISGLRKSLTSSKNDWTSSETKYLLTIKELKEELKQLNKDKVKEVLSNVSEASPFIPRSSFTSPVKPTRPPNPESPKTPTVSRSKKRRVAFGKSPSWHSVSDEEEADSTVSSSTLCPDPSKVKYVSLSKSPKVKSPRTLSAKSPKLKLSSGKLGVTDLLAKYPTPTSQKRGTKLPEGYVKRKEATENKRKQKIKIESHSSWFDSDSAFGFDKM